MIDRDRFSCAGARWLRSLAVLGLFTWMGACADSELGNQPAPASPAAKVEGANDGVPVLLDPARIQEHLSDPRAPHNYPELAVWRERLQSVPDQDGSEKEEVRIRIRIADLLMRQGLVDEALEHLTAAEALSAEGAVPVGLRALVQRWLGVGYLRSGEREHCVAHHNPERCLFPIRGEGVWSDTANALLAIQHFERSLQLGRSVGVMWLLNVAHMAAGTYPEGLPEALRIPSELYESEIPIPRFRDVAPEVGLDAVGLAGGAVLDDFDGDGRLEFVASAMNPDLPVSFVRRSADGSLEDVGEALGFGDQAGAFNLVHGDYDNDGRLDLLLLRGAWTGHWGRQVNTLMHQEEDGTFRDVTLEAGLGETAWPTLGAAFADYDNDGDLDLYVANEQLAEGDYPPSQLFRNQGDGTFVDVSKAAGVTNDRSGKAVCFGDFDNDGDADFYVANYGQPNRLYRNEGDGRFVDVAVELRVDRTLPTNRSFVCWFWDYDDDGWLDLFVGGYGTGSVDSIAGDILNGSSQGERSRLFRNDGQGGFEDVSDAVGVGHVRSPMGANYGDIDGDGYLDFYLGTGAPSYHTLVPNTLYLSARGQRFVEASSAAGVGHLQKGHGVALGDVDNDGDLDIFAQMGGLFPDDEFANAMFENPGQDRRWLTLQFRGVRSNRFGIGARVRARVRTAEGVRDLHRHVSAGGSFGGNSLQLELGLGAAQAIEELEVSWPASGQRDVFADVTLDQVLRITEGRDSFEVLNLPRAPLK